MSRGLSEDYSTYELIDGTVINIKEGVSADTYFNIMNKWLDVEKTQTLNLMDQFKKEQKEKEIVEDIFDNYTDTSYKDLSAKLDYRELVTVAGEVFAFLGKSTNSKETSRLTKLYQGTKKSTSQKKKKDAS